MTTINQNSIGSEVGRRLIKVAIAVVGLLLIRLVLGSLPMLKDAKPIHVEGAADASIEVRTAQTAFESTQAAIEQCRRLEIPVPPQVQEAHDQAKKRLEELMARAFGIYPLSIANAIVDSLIFAVLIWTAAGFKDLIRTRSKRLPEGGLIILLLVVTVVVGLAYRSYMGVIRPLLGSEANLYAWSFLVLGLLPLIGLVVVASRNLDAITEVVFSSASRTVTQAPAPQVKESSAVCAKCGGAVAAGVKFCSACGAPVVIANGASEAFCSECGGRNEVGAKYCKSCGKPLGVTR